MPFSLWRRRSLQVSRRGLPAPARIALLAFGWLLLISALHAALNLDAERRTVIQMGYMPVITNLACPLLDHASREKGGLRFRALKFSSFAEMAEALRSGEIQAAFMIAPLSIVLHQQNANVKIILIGNRHESTLVTRRDLKAETFADLAGKTIAVPMRFSGHNLCLQRLMAQRPLSPPPRVVEMNPPDMAAALMAGSLDAYFVGEPFAAQSVRSGKADILYRVEDLWPGFICNLLLVHKELIETHPEQVMALVQGAARAGLWAQNNPNAAAGIAAKYWNQPAELIRHALESPPGRVIFDRFVPRNDEIQEMADLMARFGLSDDSGCNGLVDDRFARSAHLGGIDTIDSIITATVKSPEDPSR